jgi:VanZ family protein
MRGWVRLKDWLPALIWGAMMSALSTEPFGGRHTSTIIVPFLRWLFPHASPDALDLAHDLIRKAAHVVEYSLFSLLVFFGVRGRNRGWQLRWAIWVIVISAVYAGLDEFHQVFVPGRGPSSWDSVLDTVAATTVQVLLWIWYLSREHPGEISRARTASSNRAAAENPE